MCFREWIGHKMAQRCPDLLVLVIERLCTFRILFVKRCTRLKLKTMPRISENGEIFVLGTSLFLIFVLKVS